ncbi:hypothetical protein OBO34_11145 [Clostridiales Family XIII bacterium ASD5510]|uniref:Uncharacterized protein n=1 Tax=Hominibacterium faecale TaxID=2839743 RepID=A0A9J6QV34_9FIRM|nr:hypothetical protein [Hominibacterium faecale]MCU7378911.1 hypothetical protein [Hominibacterium faecale]
MNIQYIGKNEYGAFAFEKGAQQLGRTFSIRTCEQGACFLEDLTEELIRKPASWYIFDLSSLLDEAAILVGEVEKIRCATNAKVLIFAPGADTEGNVLVSFRAMGMDNIITEATNLGELQQQFTDYLQDKMPGLSPEQQEALVSDREKCYEELLAENPHLEQLEEPEEPRQNRIVKRRFGEVVKIAVVGAMEHIGTTTTALQLTKFLNLQEERSAAYLEHNHTNYVASCKRFYRCEKEEPTLGCMELLHMELYHDPRKIPEILQQGHRFFVFDYGSIETVKDHASLFEKDLILLVGGAKPNEIEPMTDAMRSIYEQKNVFYIFNYLFTESARQGVLDLQKGNEKKTFFLAPASDPFQYNPEHDAMFFAIMNADHEKTDVTQGKRKKRKRLFGGGER